MKEEKRNISVLSTIACYDLSEQEESNPIARKEGQASPGTWASSAVYVDLWSALTYSSSAMHVYPRGLRKGLSLMRVPCKSATRLSSLPRSFYIVFNLNTY